MTPLMLVLVVAGVVSTCCWVLSLTTHDTSQVDRMWSIAPPIYLWIFAGGAGFVDARLDLMAVLGTLWGARLTFNFARKGGYSGVEDYRWAVVRKAMRPWQFQIFNLLFIAIYQNVLLVLITLPAWTALQHRSPSGPLDELLSVLFLAALAGEATADQQQWDFHRRKRAAAAGGSTTEGFLRQGLFRYSRHPNYFFEISQWWLMFGFGALAAGSLLQWTVAGAVLLTVLFVGSTMLTERISAAKYSTTPNTRRSRHRSCRGIRGAKQPQNHTGRRGNRHRTLDHPPPGCRAADHVRADDPTITRTSSSAIPGRRRRSEPAPSGY